MRAWIANTDFEWSRFLSGRPDLDEVNFWRPSGGAFRVLSPGEPLLFRLKAPYNAIVGVGFFVHFSVLPASLAWAAFGAKNGAPSEPDMRARIDNYRHRRGQGEDPGTDYKIGCIILAEPTFFSRSDWIPQPRDWRPPNRGRPYGGLDPRRGTTRLAGDPRPVTSGSYRRGSSRKRALWLVADSPPSLGPGSVPHCRD